MVGRVKLVTVGRKKFGIFRTPWGWVVNDYTKTVPVQVFKKYYKTKSGAKKALNRHVQKLRG